MTAPAAGAGAMQLARGVPGCRGRRLGAAWHEVDQLVDQ